MRRRRDMLNSSQMRQSLNLFYAFLVASQNVEICLRMQVFRGRFSETSRGKSLSRGDRVFGRETLAYTYVCVHVPKLSSNALLTDGCVIDKNKFRKAETKGEKHRETTLSLLLSLLKWRAGDKCQPAGKRLGM
ncbi:hypothetical protein AVEN_218284-1 [Araneus ventricosus]|uniref:Uncharacterized protein n=1 Tax=Araneus ventricosus TaxID=182803 RepID=A0A4Y2IQI9_ARAVE|nr:hypothetical protein AVEN_218284-1 [Araneus ventricosus]